MSKRTKKKRYATPLQYAQAQFRHPVARGAAETRQAVNPYSLLFDILHARETQNELPWLTPQRATELFNHWLAGEYAPVQIVWDQMEQYDETLATVLSARLGALAEIQWRVEIDADAVGKDENLAAKAAAQQATLTRHLNAVENLEEALLHLGMADFRGYAALEITGNPSRYKWETIEPWCLARPSRRGAWYYNPEAEAQPFRLEELDPGAVIIREARPIDLPVMFLVIAKRHAIAGWDGFLDVFGSPSIFFEMPPAVDATRAMEYDAIVQKIIGEGRGTVPNGGKFQTVETTQDNADAFSTRAKWCNDAIITLAMGGLLTVSTAPDSGTLAGSAHTDSLARLTALSARSIADCVWRQFCLPVLEHEHGAELPLVRFIYEPEEREDKVVQGQLIATLAAAGYRPSAETVSSICGFEVEDAPTAPAWNGTAPAAPMMNTAQEPPAPEVITNAATPADEPPLTDAEQSFFQSLLGMPLNPAQIQQDAQTAQQALEGAVAEEMGKHPQNAAHPVANPLHGLASGHSGTTQDNKTPGK